MPASVKASLRESQLIHGTIDPQKALWFTRALKADPFGVIPSRDGQETFVWIKKPPGGGLEGNVYTDGFLMDNDPVLQGHCKSLGWAFVVLGADGQVTAAAKGRPPAWVASIYGAELWATQMAVTHIFPGAARVVTDCESVRIGCQRGHKWATAPG
eukprot:2889637-Karenia_brevis.AAC.1